MVDDGHPLDPDVASPEGLAVAFGAHVLPRTGTVIVPDGRIAATLRREGVPVETGSVTDASDGSVDGIGLLDVELSRAGDHAEGLVAEAARALRPGGVLATTAVRRVWARLHRSRSPARSFTAEELRRLLGLAGFAVVGQWAPGAATTIGGGPARFHPEHDRLAGLLDAAPVVAAAAHRYTDQAARSDAFFASLPRKVVAAAVICRDAKGRLLCVHDSFRAHWTIPGGLVDADENPRAAAARETREEAGVDVVVEDLLGLFAMRWPDRLLLVYAAHPTGEQTPRPLHTHEIGDAAWLPLADAFARLNARTADQVRRCLEAPGGTWHDG